MADFVKRYGPWALIAGRLGRNRSGVRARAGAARREPGAGGAPQRGARGGGAGDRWRSRRCRCAASRSISRAPTPPRRSSKRLPISTSGSSSTTRRWRRAAPFSRSRSTQQLAAIDVNVRGPLALAHRFGRRLAARGSGGIVLLSSLTAFQGSPFVATYGASKSFLLSLAEGLWFELAPRGVDVLAVCAGATRTPNYLAALAAARARGASAGPGGARGARAPRARSVDDSGALQPDRVAADAPRALASRDDPDHGRADAAPDAVVLRSPA